MNKDLRDILIVVAIVAVIIGTSMGSLLIYSGMNAPITVVESGSMQHSENRSSIGVIDTGDMVVMVSPSKTSVTTYIEGCQNGHQSFGDYGDVIIYNRGDGRNPVIHRAIIWLDCKEDGTWSAPSLKDLPKGEKWSADGDWDSLSGTLTINGLGWRHLSASIDLASLPKHSGYLTNGDNNNNGSSTYFDQGTSIAEDLGLIQKTDLKAVAGFEIPCFGCIKLCMNNINVNMIPTNSIPCLFAMLIDFVMFFVILAIVINCIFVYMNEKRKEDI